MGNSYSRISPPGQRESALTVTGNYSRQTDNQEPEGLLAENVFHSMLTLERRRAERSGKPFVLMLLDANLETGVAEGILRQAVEILVASKRETDLVGWYKRGAIVGVIFAEVNLGENAPIADVLRDKVETVFVKHLGRDRAAKIAISVHLFPEGWDKDGSGWVADSKLYPDLKRKNSRKRLPLVIKRAIDIVGSGALLLVLSPFLLVIMAFIKLTSKGPIIYKQERLGQFGERFHCLKFRTMYANNDPKIHQEYVQQFIAGKEGLDNSNGDKQPVYKLVKDPRVTLIGSFLRKTSMDELPQFWNVLRGDMSLVGPRPPVPYEFEVYDIWHRRRVLEVRPGVTGLWQVSGRNRTRFDEMVRLDLRYSQNWSIWLDLKILLATPWAVLNGGGAC
ncbi:MAG TPA: sugar transferase [Verrucomicrobiae bacterium]|jgi:lipopolysaccharide/colanic/teichoic acid biosynthesis glycosyltransferase|nr:sugar transferase [Verrucomicrobiae bacterium]